MCPVFAGSLTALLAPVNQFLQDVVTELTCETWERALTFSVYTVTGRAGRNVSVGNSLL